MSQYFNNPRLNSTELRKLIPVFIREIIEDSTKFELAFKATDYENCSEILHKIKGSSLSFGITALAQISMEMGNFIQAKEYHSAIGEMNNLKQLIRELIEESNKMT